MADILHWLSYLCLFFSFHPRRSKKDDIFNFRLSNGDLVDFGMTIFHFFNISSPQAHTSLSRDIFIWCEYMDVIFRNLPSPSDFEAYILIIHDYIRLYDAAFSKSSNQSLLYIAAQDALRFHLIFCNSF